MSNFSKRDPELEQLLESAPGTARLFGFESLADDVAAAMLRGRASSWRATMARVLALTQNPDGDVLRIVYGWKDERGELRLEELDEAVKAQRLPAASARRIRAGAQAEDDLSGMSFGLLYDTQSPAHAYAARVPHVAEVLAMGASTDRTRAALVRLKALPLKQAWWAVLDVLVRVVLPETLRAHVKELEAEAARPRLPGWIEDLNREAREQAAATETNNQRRAVESIIPPLDALEPLPDATDAAVVLLLDSAEVLARVRGLERLASLLRATVTVICLPELTSEDRAFFALLRDWPLRPIDGLTVGAAACAAVLEKLGARSTP